MLKLKDVKSIAVMENEQAVLKTEAYLKIMILYTDHIEKCVKVTLKKGYIDDKGLFVKTDSPSIIVNLKDSPQRIESQILPIEERKPGLEGFIGLYKDVIIPAKSIFTDLTTPKTGQLGRQDGDFRMKDIEILIKDNKLIEDEIDSVV